MVTALPALATLSPWVSASLVALSISAALSPTVTMKCDVVATFSDISLVVSFCTATAPLTFSNTGRIASIACEIRCTASTEPAASFCSASIFLVISSVAFWVCTASALTSEATTAKPRPAEPARAASMVELSAKQRGLAGDLRDQIDDIADGGGRFPQAVDIGLGLARGGAGLIGELAGVAHLGADAFGRMGELVGGLRERGRGVVRGAGAPGQGVGALADGGERRRRGLGAAGDRIGRAFELADHRAQFEFEQFEDFLGGIAVRSRVSIGGDRGLRRLGFDGRRSRFRRTLSKQTERHGPLSGTCNEAVILAFGREVMVNDCLIRRQ